MRRDFTRRWSTPPRDTESRANAAIAIRRAAHCARHSRRTDHKGRPPLGTPWMWTLAFGHHEASLNGKTARSWRGIVAFTHLRTGGAYDSHHRTAGIAGRARRRGNMAARGARAAARANATHRRAREQLGCGRSRMAGPEQCLRPRPARTRLVRRPKRAYRVSVGFGRS